MKKFNGTKGSFKDGKQGWKVGKRKTNGVKGYEIHYSDDGECVTDHVYEMEDAVLIANAPEMLEALMNLENDNNSIPKPIWDMVQNAIKNAIM